MFGLDDEIAVRLTVRQWNFVLRLLRRFGIVYKALPIINAISEQAKAQAEAAQAPEAVQAPAQAEAQAAPESPQAPPAATTISLASEKLVRRPPRGVNQASEPSPPALPSG